MKKDTMKKGRMLPVMEHFYTLQGEGCHSGRADYFIRIGGCDVGCHWCDVKESWDASRHPLTDIDTVVAQIPPIVNTVVVTGGEPLNWNMDYLTSLLHAKGIKTHLETSGSSPLSGNWDWICLSPKKAKHPLEEVLIAADELKVIVFNRTDFDWAEKHSKKVKDGCALLLQPEWSRRHEAMDMITEYIKSHPKWRASLQSHKYMNIP